MTRRVSAAPALAAIFGATALLKLADMASFSRALHATGLFRPHEVQPAALTIVAAELAAAMCLVLRRARPLGAFLGLILSLCFVGTHTFAILSGELRNCACAGVLLRFDGVRGRAGMVFVSGLMAAGCVATLLQRCRERPEASGGRPPQTTARSA